MKPRFSNDYFVKAMDRIHLALRRPPVDRVADAPTLKVIYQAVCRWDPNLFNAVVSDIIQTEKFLPTVSAFCERSKRVQWKPSGGDRSGENYKRMIDNEYRRSAEDADLWNENRLRANKPTIRGRKDFDKFYDKITGTEFNPKNAGESE